MGFLKCALLVLMSLASSSATEKDDYMFEMPEYGSALTKSVVEIMLAYFEKSTSFVYIVQSSDPAEPASAVLQSGIINEILYNTHSTMLVQLDSPEYIRHRGGYPRYYNLFFVDGYESFRRIYDQMSTEFFNYSGYYLVILTKDTRRQYSTIRNILIDFWKKYIVNVNVIMNTLDNTWEAIMFTYRPYSEYFCGEVYPEVVNYFKHDSFLNRSMYFPRKLTNFHKCKLYVATFPCPPFMMYKQMNNGSYAVDGIEGTLLRVLSQRLNFTYDLLLPVEKWGTLMENGTASGASQLVISGEANFTLGYFQLNAYRSKYMTNSITYFTSHLILVVPPGEPFTPMEKLLFPFKRYIWLSLTVICAACVSAIIVLDRYASREMRNFVLGRNIQTPNINFVNVILGNSLHVLPERNFARFILMIWILAFLVIRTTYQGTLFSFMQDNRNKSVVQTINDMLERDFNFYMTDNSIMFFEGNPRVLERIVINNDYDLREKIRYRIIQDSAFKAATVDAVEFVALFNKKNFRKFFEYTPKEYIVTVQLAIYFTKTSCLTWRINQELSKLAANGLLKSWIKNHVDYRYLLPPKSSSEPQVISLVELVAPFQILCYGYVIAFIAFVCELLHNLR